MGGSRRGGEQGVQTSPGKPLVAIGFLRNTGMEPPREARGLNFGLSLEHIASILHVEEHDGSVGRMFVLRLKVCIFETY